MSLPLEPNDWHSVDRGVARTPSTSSGVAGRAYTGRFFETRWSPEAVILSAAKDLSPGHAQILRCAQDDTSHLAGSFPKKPTRVSPTPLPTASHCFSGF